MKTEIIHISKEDLEGCFKVTEGGLATDCIIVFGI
jgi:hypothetical protein